MTNSTKHYDAALARFLYDCGDLDPASRGFATEQFDKTAFAAKARLNDAMSDLNQAIRDILGKGGF